MDYNEKYHILFEVNMIPMLCIAYKKDFPNHEEVDELYSQARTFNPDEDKVHFVYHGSSDYGKLIKFLRKKGAITSTSKEYLTN